jgi:hypothetical protein
MKNEKAYSFADAIILQVISKAKCYMMFLVPINPWYRHTIANTFLSQEMKNFNKLGILQL